MSRITFGSVALAILLTTVSGLISVRAEPAAGDGVTGAETTVFVVRHAEKGEDDPRDPRLSEAGRSRAEALARLLGHAGVTHLFASEYRRTVETLEPLAKRSGHEITVVPARDSETLVQTLRGLPRGSVVVVAGHSNTVPALVRGLGGRLDERGLVETRGGPGLPEREFDRLFVLVLAVAPQKGALTTLDLRYGR